MELAAILQESVDKLEEAFYMWRGRQEVDSDAPVRHYPGTAPLLSPLDACTSLRLPFPLPFPPLPRYLRSAGLP